MLVASYNNNTIQPHQLSQHDNHNTNNSTVNDTTDTTTINDIIYNDNTNKYDLPNIIHKRHRSRSDYHSETIEYNIRRNNRRNSGNNELCNNIDKHIKLHNNNENILLKRQNTVNTNTTLQSPKRLTLRSLTNINDSNICHNNNNNNNNNNNTTNAIVHNRMLQRVCSEEQQLQQQYNIDSILPTTHTHTICSSRSYTTNTVSLSSSISSLHHIHTPHAFTPSSRCTTHTTIHQDTWLNALHNNHLHYLYSNNNNNNNNNNNPTTTRRVRIISRRFDNTVNGKHAMYNNTMPLNGKRFNDSNNELNDIAEDTMKKLKLDNCNTNNDSCDNNNHNNKSLNDSSNKILSTTDNNNNNQQQQQYDINKPIYLPLRYSTAPPCNTPQNQSPDHNYNTNNVRRCLFQRSNSDNTHSNNSVQYDLPSLFYRASTDNSVSTSSDNYTVDSLSSSLTSISFNNNCRISYCNNIQNIHNNKDALNTSNDETTILNDFMPHSQSYHNDTVDTVDNTLFQRNISAPQPAQV